MTDMSTAGTTSADFEQGARATKVDRLLIVWGRHVANTTGRPFDHLDPADLSIALTLAEYTLTGLAPKLSREGCQRRLGGKWRIGDKCCDDHTLLPELWHTLADEAKLPDHRHPSVTTIRTLCTRLRRRIKDITDVPVADLFKMAAGGTAA
jgi:hypothetical protein